jgi:uncharacterized protein (TIGR01370 family)
MRPLGINIAVTFFILLVLSAILLFSRFSGRAGALASVKNWFILLDYQPQESPLNDRTIRSFDMAIFDPDNHPPLEKIKNKLILISYISLGELDPNRSYWERVKDEPWVLDKNPEWGSFYVDIRDKKWQGLLLDEVIPGIISQGFSGLMLDTLDTAAMLEEKDPLAFNGAKEAMADLVRQIHSRYPRLSLISNNGFAILEEIAPYLSGMLSEDIFMMIDFKNNGYQPVPQQDREYKVAMLKNISEKYKIPVFVIDYVSSQDRTLVLRTKKKLRELGFRPYIAEKDLDRLYEN